MWKAHLSVPSASPQRSDKPQAPGTDQQLYHLELDSAPGPSASSLHLRGLMGQGRKPCCQDPQQPRRWGHPGGAGSWEPVHLHCLGREEWGPKRQQHAHGGHRSDAVLFHSRSHWEGRAGVWEFPSNGLSIQSEWTLNLSVCILRGVCPQQPGFSNNEVCLWGQRGPSTTSQEPIKSLARQKVSTERGPPLSLHMEGPVHERGWDQPRGQVTC